MTTRNVEILRAKTSIRDATDCLIQKVGHQEAERIIQDMIKENDRPEDRLFTALSHVRYRRHQNQREEAHAS